MIPRGKLYITYADIFAGIRYCLADVFGSKKQAKTGAANNTLITLSVRTGLDLVLGTLNLPQGSEVLVTDINIPDMFNIIAGHGLVAVPLPIDKHTLSLSPKQVEAAITPLTKALLITHLFGGIMETDELLLIAKKNNLVVFEDCAQAFAGSEYTGNPASDVVMYSFGFIKTNTAISGAMIRVNDPQILAEVTARNAQYPQQAQAGYLQKLCKVIFVKLLTYKIVYTLFYNLVMALGKDFEDTVSGFTRGFPEEDILKHIRFRPCNANQTLIELKVREFDPESLKPRKKLAYDILQNIPDQYKIGDQNPRHTYWVMPIDCDRPDELITYLRANGFDASQKASSLVKKLPAANLRGSNDLYLDNLVYLPMFPNMSTADRAKLSALLTNFETIELKLA